MSTLETLSNRVADLEDKEAIRCLKARYLRACDLKDVETVRDSFLSDGVLIEYEGFPVFADRDAFVETYQALACKTGVYDMHHAANWDIELTAENEARGTWSLNFRTILLESRQVTSLVVEYDDLYRRDNNRWYIKASKSTILSVFTEEIADDGSIRVVALGPSPAAT